MTGDAKGIAPSACTDEFGYRFAGASDCYCFTLLHEFEKPGKLSFGFMDVHLHIFSLVFFI